LVADAIRARGWRPIRFDTDRFPREVDLVLELGSGAEPSLSLRDGDVSADLAAVEAVWYRRFYSARLPDDLEQRYVKYSQQEARTLLGALFACLGAARWVDPIARIHRAHHKLLQLEVAKRAGLTVPATLATNDPEAARRFFDEHEGRVVTKMLNSISMAEDGREQMVFTSQVSEQDFADIEGLRHCPAVFQELVPKEVELRVAAVGDRLYVASIDASSSEQGAVDWRRDMKLAGAFVADALPEPIAAAVLEVMRTYGLVYGSLDIIRRPDGEHVFLEINAAGEWAWLATVVGLPIAEAIADVLTGRTTVDRSQPRV
jgi:glutathione synthase/RimK-type ligase-like ATP-grasp enzyme